MDAIVDVGVPESEIERECESARVRECESEREIVREEWESGRVGE